MNYILIKQRIVSGNLFGQDCNMESPVCKLSNNLRGIATEPMFQYYLDSAVQKVSGFIVDSISNFLFSIPVIIFNLFIMIFIMFFLFRDGKELIGKVESLSPLKKPHYHKILKKFDEVIYAVVFGQIIVALIQGGVGALGLFILGVRSPLFLGLVMAFLAILPVVGPPVVWLPIAALMIIDGYLDSSNILIIKGIILILYGSLVVGTIDNILRPKLIADKAKLHPVLVLLGVLGGLQMFGLVGVIIGPVALAIFITFIKIYEDEKGAFFT
jgi:predicted PurR-regulated permease PerM